MKLRDNKGLTGTDVAIAVLALIIFSTLIISLILSNALENVKITTETMAMIYITEIFENIGIAEYDAVIMENIDKFVPQDVYNKYTVDMQIENINPEGTTNQDVIKKITLNLSYEINEKIYNCSMERLKVKESI